MGDGLGSAWSLTVTKASYSIVANVSSGIRLSISYNVAGPACSNKIDCLIASSVTPLATK